MDFAFSPGGGFLVTQATNAVSLNVWELRTDEGSVRPALTLKTNLPFWGPAAFSPDDRTLALCNPEGGLRVNLYDLVDGTLTRLPAAQRWLCMEARLLSQKRLTRCLRQW